MANTIFFFFCLFTSAMLRNDLFLNNLSKTLLKKSKKNYRIKEECEDLQYLGIRAIKAFLGNDPLNGLKQPCITTVHIPVGKQKYFSYTF